MRVVITGAGGFIGSHLGACLKEKPGVEVVGVDVKMPEFVQVRDMADEFLRLDMRNAHQAAVALEGADVVYALAANMGGIGFIGDQANDLDILLDNLTINANTARAARLDGGVRSLVFSSSACVYNEALQMHGDSAPLAEADAYPAMPDSLYGWEKLMGEMVYESLGRVTAVVPHIVRFHNIYGPRGTWQGGREKAPAALCRKVAVAKLTGNLEVEIWGDGEQTRSFCFIDDCVRGLVALAESDFQGPVNLGTSRSVTINELAGIIAEAAGIDIQLKHVAGIQGVRGRNADLGLIYAKLGWEPQVSLEAGIATTYQWIEGQVCK